MIAYGPEGEELCDDGNADQRYLHGRCVPAQCGDGIHRLGSRSAKKGYEGCDDANVERGTDAHRGASRRFAVTDASITTNAHMMTATAPTPTTAPTTASKAACGDWGPQPARRRR